MAKLIYFGITSLDGYAADEDGNFGWSAPDEEVHTFINDFERPVGTYLYGRRAYEVMRYWETADTRADLPGVERDWAAIWQAADKIVYSGTLGTVSGARTRIERDFDGRRHAVAPRPGPPGGRASRRTPFPQRRRLPSLPHPD